MPNITHSQVEQLKSYVSELKGRSERMESADARRRFPLMQYLLQAYVESAHTTGLNFELLTQSFDPVASEQTLAPSQLIALGRIATELRQNPDILKVSTWPRLIYSRLTDILGKSTIEEATEYYRMNSSMHAPLQVFEPGRAKELEVTPGGYVDYSIPPVTPTPAAPSDDDKKPAASSSRKSAVLTTLLAIGGFIAGAAIVAAIIYFAAPFLPVIGAVGGFVAAHTGLALSSTMISCGIFGLIGGAVLSTGCALAGYFAARKPAASKGYKALEADKTAGIGALGIHSALGTSPTVAPALTAKRSTGKLIIADPEPVAGGPVLATSTTPELPTLK